MTDSTQVEKQAAGLTEKLLREALENFSEPGNFIQSDTDVPWHWTPGDVFIQKIVDPNPWEAATEALTLPKTQAEKQVVALLDLFRAVTKLEEVTRAPSYPAVRMNTAIMVLQEKAHACREAGLE